ncbi:LamG domain-containing protein [Nocardioides deserti]|uniref:Laminin G domain-containing protein n=1 Tax=Nocardioides deserti TaxID=1588644 RepID=A0ABR6U6C5_9ACTN|nr:LamG domain-containing protein [Nocardioides deserti]MBC2959985.1 hypothetical protein [Nocardioides deserti]GGO75270.1 hypothetical protein GCM10012276_25230 [Nocardioides deserti]
MSAGRTASVVVVVVAVLGLPACQGDGADRGAAGAPAREDLAASTRPTTSSRAVPGRELLLTFDDGAAPVGSVIGSVANRGRQEVEVAMVTHNGGRIVREVGTAGTGARLPAVDEDETTAAAAAVVVRPVGPKDRLSPGGARFVISADFVLDADSVAPHDDGDNIVQRGLYADAAQYKLQVDGRRVSCRVEGDRGEVVVRSSLAVRPGRWYSATCSRRGQRLTLTVAGVRNNLAWARPRAWTASGPIGSVAFDPAVPVTVGAKVLAAGDIATSDSDQFNGALDNVRIDRPGR